MYGINYTLHASIGTGQVHTAMAGLQSFKHWHALMQLQKHSYDTLTKGGYVHSCT